MKDKYEWYLMELENLKYDLRKKLIDSEQKTPFDFKSEVSKGVDLDYGDEYIPPKDDVESLGSTDSYAEITESIKSKVLNELKNDDTLAGYLGVSEAEIQSMDIEQLGDLLNKICNR